MKNYKKKIKINNFSNKLFKNKQKINNKNKNNIFKIYKKK